MVVILIDPKRAPQGSTRVVRRQREREALCVKGFIVVSMRRNRRGKLNGFRIV